MSWIWCRAGLMRCVAWLPGMVLAACLRRYNACKGYRGPDSCPCSMTFNLEGCRCPTKLITVIHICRPKALYTNALVNPILPKVGVTYITKMRGSINGLTYYNHTRRPIAYIFRGRGFSQA
jgi:hypothetical protein